MSKERKVSTPPLKIDLSSARATPISQSLHPLTPNKSTPTVHSPLILSPGSQSLSSSSSSSSTSLNAIASSTSGSGSGIGIIPNLSRQKSTGSSARSRRDSGKSVGTSGNVNLSIPGPSRVSPRSSPRSSPGLSPRFKDEDGGSYFTLPRQGSTSSNLSVQTSLKGPPPMTEIDGQSQQRAASSLRKYEAGTTGADGNGGSGPQPPTSPSIPVLSPSNSPRPHSPVRALSNSYAPARVPSHQSISSASGKGKTPQSPIHDESAINGKSGGITNNSIKQSGQNTSSTNRPSATAAAAVTAAANSDSATMFSRRKDAHLSYLAQEPVYIHKMTSAIGDDYYAKGSSSVSDSNSDIVSDDDEDSVSEVQPDVIGFGGVGTSFDDEYTDLGSSYPFLETTYNNGSSTTVLPNQTTTSNNVNNVDNNNHQPRDGKVTTTTLQSIDESTPEQWRERLEWQAMLASVLTGEVFRAEKRRIRQPKKSGNGVDEEEMWLGLRAKVSGRTVIEQKRVLDYSRSTVTDALERVMNFKIENPNNTTSEDALRQLDPILQLLYRCEGLYRTVAVLKTENALYAGSAFQAKVDCLQSWKSITDSINQELELLRRWTGNSDIDPSRAPEKSTPPNEDNGISMIPEEKITLVESILKQDNLSDIFDRRISNRLGPLIEKAREATIKYSDMFLELGLPLFNKALLHVMVFPITLIREIIQMRLTYARRLVNPTMMIVDQMILDFQAIISHALVVMDRNIKYTSPILDKGWIFPTQIDESFNSTLLDCVNFYLELLNKKFLDGGRSSKSLFRAYKETEQLEQHYTFLLGVGRLVAGGDIAVAELITSLESKILQRLLTYWEHQMKGPQTWAPAEIERWFATTMEIIRSFQRKLLRFHK